MHRFLRSRFVFGILAVSGLNGFAHPDGPKPVTAQHVTIRVYSLPEISSRMLSKIMKNAARILAAAGVDPIWQQGPLAASESRVVDLNVQSVENSSGYQARGYIVIVIVNGIPSRYFPGALGYALPNAQIGANVTIFYDRIESITKSGAIDLAPALGRVMAHEIGHVLLGSTEHARKGIMRAVWSEDDFRISAFAAVGFTASQRVAIRKRLPVQGECHEPDTSLEETRLQRRR